MSYTEGTRVEFKITGTIRGEGESIKTKNDPYGVYANRVVGDDGCVHFVYLHSDNTKVLTPPDPVGWKPREGDIWKVGQDEYYVRKLSYNDSVVIMPFESSKGRSYYENDEAELNKFKALKPVLVRRRPKLTVKPVDPLSALVADTMKRYGGRIS